MNRTTFMLIAGEPSGDRLAADLVHALRKLWETGQIPTGGSSTAPAEPLFFGAGGKRMAEAGVEIVLDLTQWAVTGLTDVLRSYRHFHQAFHHLIHQAFTRTPDLILCVDFSGFNRRFARAIRQRLRAKAARFFSWNPKIVQYVSPQVWASRPGRAKTLEQDLDLLLSIFPFEKEWYARHAPRLRVEYVGHPLADRYPNPETLQTQRPPPEERNTLVLLPGSRLGELQRHVPLLLKTWEILHAEFPGLSPILVIPEKELLLPVSTLGARSIPVQVGNLSQALRQAALALACTGTVTLECAWHLVPAVTFYRTSWPTYLIGRCIVQVPYLSMPNLLAGEEIYPEFIQHHATPNRLAEAAARILRDPQYQRRISRRLLEIVRPLAQPGASERAAQQIWALLSSPHQRA